MISTSTSPVLGPSRSTSWISSGWLGATAMAALVFIVPPALGARDAGPLPRGRGTVERHGDETAGNAADGVGAGLRQSVHGPVVGDDPCAAAAVPDGDAARQRRDGRRDRR